MKKNILSIIAVISMSSAITFSSCEKIEEGSPITINNSNTATISGMIYANIKQDEIVFTDNIDPAYNNETYNNAEDTLEYAPSGTEIHFRVNKHNFNSDVEDTDDQFLYTTTVDANGRYSYSIPTVEEGVDVHISFDDFEIDSLFWIANDVSYVDSTYYDTIINQQVTVKIDSSLLYTSTSSRVVYSRASSSVTIHKDEDVILDFQY